MIKQSLRVWLQVIIGVAIYFALQTVIENDVIIISILVVVMLILILYGASKSSKNPADHLEVLVNPEKFIESIFLFNRKHFVI